MTSRVKVEDSPRTQSVLGGEGMITYDDEDVPSVRQPEHR
jgi:hypothetical protein